MNDIPCINPVCSHLFRAEEVTRVNVLKCPQCGQEIRFRAGASPAPTPVSTAPIKKAPPMTAPVARPTPQTARTKEEAIKASSPPPPRAKPVAPPTRPVPPALVARVAPPVVALPPPASPVPAASDDDPLSGFAAITSGLSFAPPRSAKRSWSYVTVFAIGFIILGSLLAVFLGIRRFRGAGDERGPTYAGPTYDQPYEILNVSNRNEAAFKMVLPKDKGWTRDEGIKKKFKAQAGWFDQESEVWVAVMASDFGFYKPRDAELIRKGMEQLNSLYGETLEMEQLPKDSTIAGKSARKLEFKGRDGAVIHWGELHLFSHQGIGFWLYVVGPELEKCQSVLQWLEEHHLGVALLDNRKGWRAQPPKMETFASITKMATLTVPHGVWVNTEPFKEKDVDVIADLTLLAVYRKEKDNLKNAHVQVYQLEPQPDLDQAMKRAKEHVLALKSAGGGVGFTLVASPDGEPEELGKLVDIVGRKGRAGEFCMMLNDKRERFYSLAVVNEADRLFVVSCDIVWDNRHIWTQEFLDLVMTLKIREK